MYPSFAFFNEVRKMDRLFVRCHPEYGISQCFNVVKNFTELLKKNFPLQNPKILHHYALVRTRIRIRLINNRVKTRGRLTFRGKMKTADVSHYNKK